jgi:lipopolysaccharide transport system ATP-binding protein
MSDVVIRAENLGKKYRIQHQRERQRYVALRDVVADKLLSPWRRLSNSRVSIRESQSEEDFWALRDVSFEIKQGEVVGIIGRNGAGKSTLLKILSRITEPTNGRVGIKGRVASLLEVGTGFHPELTGRENIYLNGAILGMGREEIKRKFDEIVAFAEVEKFLDTPVKRYSSGMYVRLAFAVAANLEPEILIVDEVLAVGDAEFQRKCLGKMGDVVSQGRTVLFVSHNLSAIQSLCSRALLLQDGELTMSGSTNQCIDRYLPTADMDSGSSSVNFSKPPEATLWVTSARIISNSQLTTQIYMGDPFAIEVSFASIYPIRNPKLGVRVSSTDLVPVFAANNRFQKSLELSQPVTEGTIRCSFGIVPFVPRRYVVSLFLGDESRDHHTLESSLAFDVLPRNLWGTVEMPCSNRYTLWWPTDFEFISGENTALDGAVHLDLAK